MVLTKAGERGIGVQAIAKHVYNMNCTFFSQPDYPELHTYVQKYLLRNSKSAKSLVEHTGQRGRYRLNTKGSKEARQLILKFSEKDEEQEEEEEKKPQQDLSLSLFDEELTP